jgi:hypothetical protein
MKYYLLKHYEILRCVKSQNITVWSITHHRISKYFKKLRNITLTQTCGGSGNLRNIM